MANDVSEGVKNMDTNEIELIKEWRKELEAEKKNLRREFDEYERDVKFLNAKIAIASRASGKVGFRNKSDFQDEVIEPLESELDRLERDFEEGKESSNKRYSFVIALLEEIDVAFPKDPVRPKLI